MNHIKQIAACLPAYALDAMLIIGACDELYAVGFQGEGYTLITPEKACYSTDSRYIEAAEQIDGVELSMIGGGNTHLSLAVERVKQLGLKRIGIEEDCLSVADYRRLCEAMPDDVTFVDAQQLLESLRAGKDAQELAMIRKAQEIAERAFAEILNDIRVGVTETEIAARLTYLMMSMGAEKNSFDPIVASGPNSSMPHAIPTTRAIQRGDFVTLDFGCIYGGYCSDLTRTVCVGEPSEEMRRVYQVVLDAQLAGIAAARAGVSGSVIHNAAHDVIREAGYGDYFGHSFGHSLGIEIHENPGARPSNLQPMPLNCVLSAEPGIYLPGKFGVRIEDLLLLTQEGNINLTAAPKHLIVL